VQENEWVKVLRHSVDIFYVLLLVERQFCITDMKTHAGLSMAVL